MILSPTSFRWRSRRAAQRSALLLILLGSCLSACYREITTSWDDLDPFLRFRVDGALVEYRSLGELFGQYTHTVRESRDALSIVGWDASTGLHLSVSSVSAYPGLGTYTIGEQATDSTFRMGLYYQHPDGIGYLTREDATIVFSHIGPSSIGGSFFGVLESTGRPDLMITDGEFMVRREHDRTE
jgi:hypothetical protein